MGRRRIASPEEMLQAGASLASTLTPNTLLLFSGDLGSGKTTFIKGLISALTGTPHHHITSPTFVTLNIYEGKLPVYHFDLYRLTTAQEFYDQGFDEYFSQGGICCIEWPDILLPLAAEKVIRVEMEYVSEEERSLLIHLY